MNILIIEDSQPLATVYEDILKEISGPATPHTIYTTESLEDFINKKWMDVNFDLVLSDWMLERGTAEDLLKLIRERSQRVVVITGYPGDKKLQQCCNKLNITEVHAKTAFTFGKGISFIYNLVHNIHA